VNIPAGTELTVLRVLLWILVPPAVLLLHRSVPLVRSMYGEHGRDRVEPIAAEPGTRPSMRTVMSLCGVGTLLALAWGLLRFLLSANGTHRTTRRSPSVRVFVLNALVSALKVTQSYRRPTGA